MPPPAVTAPGTVTVVAGGRTRQLWVAGPSDGPNLLALFPRLARRELEQALSRGQVLVLDGEDGAPAGCAGLVHDSSEALELVQGEALLSFEHLRERTVAGLTVLHRAQEACARAAGRAELTAVRAVDDQDGLEALTEGGFRAVDYLAAADGDWPQGARIVLSKSLAIDPDGFVAAEHAELVAAGAARSLAPAALELDDRTPFEVGLEPGAERLAAATRLLDAGYVGVGTAAGALVFRRPGRPPGRRPSPVAVFDECSPLREVVLNYPSYVSQITADSAINAVAARNVGRVDPIAELDEYRAFVAALEREGVRVVRSGARSAEGKYERFARDSAFVVGEQAFLAPMVRRKRRTESKALSALLRDADPVDLRRVHGAHVEGGDVLVASAERLFVGEGARTNAAGIDALAAALPGVEIVRVPHDDLHLDVLFTILGQRLALVHRPGLPAWFLDRLAGEGWTFVDCAPAEQPTLGANVVCLAERRVLAAAGNVETNAALRAQGVEVVEVDLANIVLHGGGPRCMTCPTVRGDR